MSYLPDGIRADGLGQISPSTSNAIGVVATVASGAMVYHGYKRTGSVLWALVYGLAGPLAVPFALAQGFGKKKGSTP